MIKAIITASLVLLAYESQCQKFGHYESEYVMGKMPGFETVDSEIEKLTQLWYEEIKNLYFESAKLQNKLEAERILLTPEMIAERQMKIDYVPKQAKDYHYQVFGPEGLRFLKKKERIKPKLDEIFDAVEKVCKRHGLDYLFDKSGDMVMTYTNPVHDYTDYVLEELKLGDPIDTIKQ